MQKISDYFTTPEIQLFVNMDFDKIFNLTGPIITYFKKTYIAPEIFIKDETALKNIGMKWNETTLIKIPKDIHLLGRTWLKVKIPYFQMIEKLTSTTTTTTNDANVNEMIYDNNETYLIIYNNKYYLIPTLFLELPDLSYNEFKFKFSEIKKYFIDLASVNISDNTDVIFYSFNMNNFYVHDIIPTVLNLSSSYEKLTLNKLLNGKDRYKQNLLTQNSFDNYITTIVEDNIINEYQNIQKFDSTIDSSYYNFMALEFDVLYNNAIDTNSDVYLVENYINTSNINTINSIDKIKQNTITKTSLVYQYIITDLNPSFEKTFTFYKKIATITTDSLYEFTLTEANISNPTPPLGQNKITYYYPTYKVNITSLNLPFTLTTDMIIKTANDLSVTYSVVGTDNIFTIDDTSTTSLEKLKLIINTNNDSLNEPNINITFPDTNNNAEWTNNLLINLGKLDYNKQLEVLLFYQFKKNYFSKESIITNEVLTFNSSVNSIKTFWIELKVVEDRFKKQNSTIGFNNNEWNDAYNNIYINTFKYIDNIENQPQDIFNVYCIIVNKLYDTLKYKYFSEFTFIKFFYNKIFSYMYQRYYNISKLENITDFKGLLFYYNIDLLYYIDRNIIKHYLLELFYMENYIAYVPLNLVSLQLERNNIKDYMTTSKTDINTSSYFHELKYVNVYYLFGPTYIFKNDNIIAIKKEYTNYIYYNTNLVEFQLIIKLRTKLYINILSYSIDDTYVYLTFDNSIYTKDDIIINSYSMFFQETIKLSVPVIYMTEAGTLNYNLLTLYDKSNGTNLFITYNTLYVSIPVSNVIIKYTINSNVTVYQSSFNGTSLTGTLPNDYTNYDKIELTYYILPTTTVNIKNTDCNKDILVSFPFIELKKSSLTTDELALFTTGNTIRLKLTSSGGYTNNYIQSVIKKTDLTTIYLYCYFDGNITSYTSTINNNGLYAVIFENSYLPNLYNYTSLNSQTCETNDYMCQKPTIIAMKTLGDYMYIMSNFPKMLPVSDPGSYPGDSESLLTYIDNTSIIKIDDLDCNQLIRDDTNKILYSSHYGNLLLTDQKYMSTIKTIVETEYNGIYEDIYKLVVDVIENSQNEYINSYTEILDYIDTSYKLGKTLQEIAIHTKLLNSYTLTSNISVIKIGLTETSLVDFDSYTLLATSLYNFTNRDGNTFSVDNTMISALGYKYNTSIMKIINSPWHCYKPYVKINPIIIKYLDRYSSYSINMLDNINNNLSALEIVNNKNFPQEFNNEYQMKAKYFNLTSDANEYIITSNTTNNVNFIQLGRPDYITDATIDGKKVEVSELNTPILYSTEKMDPYKYKPVYDKTKIDNMNCYYNLAGAVSIINNKINNDFNLPEYIITDNKTIIKTTNYKYFKKFSENFYGINYNCLKIELNVLDKIDISNFTKFAIDNMYVYKFTVDASNPFAESTNYIISINSQTGYLINNGGIITLCICKNIVLNVGTTINYKVTLLSDNNIFSAINNNTQTTFTLSYSSTIYNITSINIYTQYNTQELSVDISKAVLLDADYSVLLQTYGKSVYKLFTTSNYHLYYLENYIQFIFITIPIKDTDKIPPLNINYNTISYYNPFQSVSDITNPNSWLIFKNTSNEYELQFKDIDTTSFANGSYLVYYNSSGIKPITYKYPDRYKFQITYNDKSYNKIANIIISATDFSIDTNFLYVVSIYDNTGATLQYTKLFKSLSTDKKTIYLEPQRDYIYTTVYYNINPTGQSYRPIILTTLPVSKSYEFTNTSVNAMVTYTGDSLTYIDNSTNAYTDAVANVRITNILNKLDPTALISPSLTTTSPFISISTETSGGNTYFVINLLPKKTIGFDYYNMIELYTSDTNEKIILWLYLKKTSPTNKCIPRRIANNANSIALTEPMRFDNSTDWYVKLLAGETSYVYNNVDTNYYNVNGTNQYITLPTSTTNDIIIDSDSYYNFNEVINTTNTRLINADTNKYIKSLLNPWSYIKYIETINGIYIDDLTLQKFDYFIFQTQDNKNYFNIKFENITTGIQMMYNLDIEKADVYIYDYKPIFITCNITYNIVNNVAYIYVSKTSVERNEIIRIGYAIIQILRWSNYYNCFIGNILYSSSYVTMYNGYYSFGVFTNYLSSNTFLKNTNNSSYIFYKFNNLTPIVGEYYIKNNILYQYVTATGALTGYIFKQKDGCYIDLYYIDTKWYYDDTLVNLKEKYTINYSNDIYIIKSLSGNEITWETAPTGPLTDKVRAFVPYQPFEIVSITIVSKIITSISNYNGWIEIYIGGNLKLYKVNNGTIDTVDAIADGTYSVRTINLDTMDIKNDFNNSLSLTDVYNNADISINITLNAKTDETYVYFKSNIYINFNTNNINCVYYQSIIINNIWYKIIDITTDNIYINIKSTDNTIFVNNQECNVIFSAGNVNNTIFISNKQILRNSSKIEYPIMMNNSSLTTLFKGNFNFTIFNFSASINTSNKTLGCAELYNLINFYNNNNYQLTSQYFYENYIPMTLNTSTYVYSQDDLSIINSDKTLLLEVTEDGSLFQHYINISLVDHIITITNTNTFQNIKTSFFYLHNIIPCNITNYNKIILLPPEYYIYRPINCYDRKMMNYILLVELTLETATPVFTNNKWKYKCKSKSTNLSTYKKVQLYVNGSKAYLDNIIFDIFDIYIDDYQETFNNFYYYEYASVSEITPIGRTTKSEYSEITTTTLNSIIDLNNNYKLKQINRLYLSKVDVNNILVFKDNNNTNVNFGDIDNTTYIGKNNLITYSTINTNSQYILNTTYSILDTNSTSTLYNITTNYTLTSPYYCIIEPEISTTEPSLELFINDEGISVKSIVGELKPWKDWTLITTRYNLDLKPYLNNYAIVYNGTTFSTTTSATTFYTNDEIAENGKIKIFLKSMYKNGTINTNAKNIFNELLLVETYLFPKLINYFSQRFFWDDIINIITKIVANYTSSNGYTWTVANNILCIQNEFTLYPENFELVDGIYIRKNYLSKDYTITFAALDANITVARNASKIDTNIGFILNGSNEYNLEGTSIDNIIQTLLAYSTKINSIKSTLPLYYNYMDSVKYYISKLYFELQNANNNNLGPLSEFNRSVKFSSAYQYFGKYYTNTFKERYFGINGLNHYDEITNSDNDIMYVKGNIVGDLYSFIVSDNDINKMITNNIFDYSVSIDNNQYKDSDLIKANNTYTIDIKDNYNHLVDPTIDNVNINTNTLDFYTTEMVQPTDISILSSEPYNIIEETNYGPIMTIYTTTLLNSTYEITIGDLPILFIGNLGNNNYKIAYNPPIANILINSVGFTNSPDVTSIEIVSTGVKYYNYINYNNTFYPFISASTYTPDGINYIDRYRVAAVLTDMTKNKYYDFILINPIGKILDKVVIKTATKNTVTNRTYLTFSSNYNNQFIYIYINEIIYTISTDGGYYINKAIDITTNEIYTVFKTFSYTLITPSTEYVSDFVVNKDIVPIKYNQTNTSLPAVFNIDNLTINKVEILQNNKVRTTYNIIDKFTSNGTILKHNYRLNESVPYEVTIATPVSNYFYQVNNTYKMELTDIMSFNTGAIATTISKIENNIITFYTGTYYITDDLNNYNQIITKNYTLTGTSYLTSTIIKANIPSNLVNKNSTYILVENNGTTTHNITNILFEDYLYITTDASIPLTGLKLRQTITDTTHSISQNLNNQLYLIETATLIYTIINTYSIVITDTFYFNIDGLITTISKIEGGIITFYLNMIKTTTELNNATLIIGKNYNLTIIGYDNTTLIVNRLTNLIDLSSTYLLVETNNTTHPVTSIVSGTACTITELPDDLDPTGLKLRQQNFYPFPGRDIYYDLFVISYVGTTIIGYIIGDIFNPSEPGIFYLVYNTGFEEQLLGNITLEDCSIINTVAGITTAGLILKQTVNDNNHIVTQTTISTNNIKYLNLSPYFIPIIQTLDSSLNEFDAKYFYTFTFTPPITFTFGTFIYIYYNDVYIKGLVIMIQSTSAIIGTNTFIPNGTALTIYSTDLTQTLSATLNNIYYTYYKGEFIEYVSNTQIKVLLPMNSMYTYNKNSNTTTNKVVINFRYTENNLINNTYPLVGFNKVPDITSTSTTNTTNYLDIEWVENVGVKLFKSIELQIDDTIVEKINPNIYKIISNYFQTMFKRESFGELITLRTNKDNSSYYYLPLPFFFSVIENYLPVSSMGRSIVKIKFVLEKLENLITNNVSTNYTLNVIPNVDFNYTFMTVDNKVLDKFKKTELLITPFYYYQNYLLNKAEEYNHLSLLSRTIELFFITQTKYDTPNYITTIVRDSWYQEYLANNPNDATTFNTIDAEIAANSNRYQTLKNHLIIKNYNTRFAMYLDTKHLVHINENLNDLTLKFSNKLTALSLYFQNVYQNETIDTYQPIINSLNILVNGKELLPELPSDYVNRVIPYNKGLSLPDGYNMYSFNFQSLASQPNGFANMRKIRDFLIYSSQVNTNQEYKLKICTREYKILKIDNLVGKIIQS